MMKKEEMYMSISSQKEWEKLLWADMEWLLAAEDFLSRGKSEKEKNAISQDNKQQKKKEEKKSDHSGVSYMPVTVWIQPPPTSYHLHVCPFNRKTELGLCW